VADLRISNFRGVQEGYIRFGPHTVLTGPSNVGKTTLIEGLALLFGRDRLVRELTEHDFTGSSPQPADRIVLVATISGFGTENPDDHLEWFRDGRGISKFLDPISGRVHPTRDELAWTLCCQVGFQARFDRDELVVETVRYFHDDDAAIDPFSGDAHVVVPTKLIQTVGFYLVRASRTWDGVISFGSELFRRTVAVAVLPKPERRRYLSAHGG
jgi:putative ATP-dependent endonuclease of the OLD family